MAPRGIQHFGDYQLLHEIARGGMGVVYKATHLPLNRVVAVKMLLFGKLAGDDFVKRFRAEAEAIASLQHPNIVAIHEVGEHEGQQYFSMDYVEGTDLAALVREKPPPAKRAAAYLKAIAEAIHYAHQRGILHRDLKPSNILLDASDQPRITDFGLAKRLTDSQPSPLDSQVTTTGQVLGTPHYMPPEQAAGKRDQVGPASDVYSLGAILYHLLAGRPPFLGETLEATLAQLLHTDPPAPRLMNPGIPRDLQTICLKCLNKEPARRYASAQALAEDLGRWLNGEPIHARAAGPGEKLWSWCRRKPALAASVTLVLLLLLTVAVGSTVAAVRINNARTTAAAAEGRAKRSQAETMDKLWDSYLAQARANRRSGQPGQRFDTLDVIAKAVAIKSSPELRDEAVAALALLDARRSYLHTNSDAGRIVTAFDPELQRYAAPLPNGEISIRSTQDSREQFRLPRIGALIAGIQRFSETGDLLMAVYHDKVARVWDLARRRVILEAPTTVEPVAFSAVLSADGRVLASADGRSPVKYFDVSTGRETAQAVPRRPANLIQVTRTGDRLAAGTGKRATVEVFAMPSGQRLASFRHLPYVRKVAWHADGRLLASIGGDRDIRVWDVETGAERRRLVGHNQDIEDVIFAPAERLIISSGWDGTSVWNYETGERLLTLPEHGVRVTLSRDGRWLYRQPFDRFRYELWELAGGQPIRTYGSNQPRVRSSAGSRASAFSRDGSLMADADSGEIRFYDPQSGRELGAGSFPPTAGMAFDAGLNLWASGTDGLQFLPCHLDVSNRTLTFGTRQSIGPAEPMERMRLSADGSTMAVGADDRCVIFDVQSRKQVFATPRGSGNSFLSLNHDGTLLALTGWGAQDVQIWNPKEGILVKRLSGGSDVLVSAEPAFSVDGQWLFTSGMKSCEMWQVGPWLRRWTRSRRDLPFAMFAPDGAYVLQRERNSFVQILASATGTRLGQIEMPRMEHGDCGGAAFSPDGTFLALHLMGTRELLVWNLRGVREHLARLGLDWDLPPLQDGLSTNPPPLSVRFVEE